MRRTRHPAATTRNLTHENSRSLTFSGDVHWSNYVFFRDMSSFIDCCAERRNRKNEAGSNFNDNRPAFGVAVGKAVGGYGAEDDCRYERKKRAKEQA